MATARRLVEADRYTREGRFRQWEYMLLLGGDIHGKTLGVVGFGRIGRAVARRALGFGMRVLYQDAVAADPAVERELNATRTDLATLLRQSDFVTLHTPLSAETRHLINAESLRTMKRTAYLINAARGPVVHEAALVEALKEGRIAGAGLDVFEEEPTVHPGLIGLPNVVLAPHIASASHETRLKMATLAVENCLAVLEGKTPPTPVNPEVLTHR
jgi:glyoxylate reductase